MDEIVKCYVIHRTLCSGEIAGDDNPFSVIEFATMLEELRDGTFGRISSVDDAGKTDRFSGTVGETCAYKLGGLMAKEQLGAMYVYKPSHTHYLPRIPRISFRMPSCLDDLVIDKPKPNKGIFCYNKFREFTPGEKDAFCSSFDSKIRNYFKRQHRDFIKIRDKTILEGEIE